MSISRLRFKSPCVRHVDSELAAEFSFVHPAESIVVNREEAADMHTLIDKMQRGLTPSTRVAEYSSMICSDTKKLLDNPPVDIQDPTDVPDMSEFDRPDVSQQEVEPLNQE